jgi:hypothetical protein
VLTASDPLLWFKLQNEIMEKSDNGEVTAFDGNSLWHEEEYLIYSKDKLYA